MWASRIVTLSQGAVWFQHWAMDRCVCRGKASCACGAAGDRCYIGTVSLADRLGVSERVVEEHRAWLRGHDLLEAFRRVEGRNQGWIAVLPITLPVGQRVTWNDVPQLRDLLDEHLRGRDDWTAEMAKRQPQKPVAGGEAEDRRNEGAATEERRGVANA